VEIERAKLIGKPLLFNSSDKTSILDIIQQQGNFFIDIAEIAQGIVPNPDRVNSRNIKTIGQNTAEERGIRVGDGVFVLDANEDKVIKGADRRFLKSLYEPTHLDRYHRTPTELSIVYTKKGLIVPAEAPSIISHLSRFREIMEERRENQTGQIAFYNLHWPRDESFFRVGDKILAPRKCASPVFYYTHDPAYVMLSINVIKTSRLNMQYLSAILNSSTIRYWLRYRGNMQGLNFQIDAGPIQQIPIVNDSSVIQDRIARLVVMVQCAHRSRESPSSTASQFLEDLIDACVMECYFHDHMAERDLLFLDDLGHHLANYDPTASEKDLCEFLTQFYGILNAPSSKIRNRLLRLTADSPDLLGVIKAEGNL
jgi:adenine-specific DNA-methyltransferase